MTLVRLEPAALRSRVKHSTIEPLRSLGVFSTEDEKYRVFAGVGGGGVTYPPNCLTPWCIPERFFFSKKNSFEIISRRRKREKTACKDLKS